MCCSATIRIAGRAVQDATCKVGWIGLRDSTSLEHPYIGLRQRRTNRIRFDARVPSGEPAQLRINVFDFPGWTLEVDGRLEKFTDSDDPLGRLHVSLAAGSHTVVARFENTLVRSIGNSVSLLSIVVVLVWTAVIIRSR